MSRYTIDSKAPEHRVVVGFDRPLNCYFANVFDAESGLSIMDVERDNVFSLRIAIAPYAYVSLDLVKLLRNESSGKAPAGLMRDLRSQS